VSERGRNHGSTATSTSEPADALVIFGITGDLARKMTFDALYRLEARGRLGCPIVGVAIDDWDAEALRSHARDAIAAHRDTVDEEVLGRLLGRLSYAQGDYADEATFGRVAAALAGAAHPVFYLEIPPALFGTVVRGLGAAELTTGARVVVEKPFGHDLASARALNRELLDVLDESQILRIDHFLGKEPVMDLTYLRFANTLLEPVWNRSYISHVQMTMAEDLDVADRGGFYDAVGTLRDVVQNHLLQVLALVAMEPPARGRPDAIREQKLELFRAVRAADPKRYVRGQYEGYLDVDGVADDSTTETYVALELEVENWRWSGVPFFIRAGKSLPVKATEVNVVFKRAPDLGLGRSGRPEPNQLVVRIEPRPGAVIRFLTKRAGDESVEPADLKVLFEHQPDGGPTPYERLLDDALHGERQLFTREDSVEETWRIVEPLLDDRPKVIPYAPGSWGPAEATDLTRGVCEWYEPWMD